MLYEMGKATLLIFLAELGDKTQILAMAFALQYTMRQVLVGVALGSFLNHGLAVIIGAYLAHVIPLSTIRLSSAFLFLGFGLWSLRIENDQDHETKRGFKNPIFIVALAFFLGELGDKTQLTAIALASNASFPGIILIGTVTGMVFVSFAGIIVGTKLGERIPHFSLKLISSAVFIAFGLFYLVETVPERFLTLANISAFLTILVVAILALILPPLIKRRRAGTTNGELKRVAKELHALDRALHELCLGEESCRNENCPVGYCKRLIKEELQELPNQKRRVKVVQPFVKRNQKFDPIKVKQALLILEKANLDSSVQRELKINLEKLTRR